MWRNAKCNCVIGQTKQQITLMEISFEEEQKSNKTNEMRWDKRKLRVECMEQRRVINQAFILFTSCHCCKFYSHDYQRQSLERGYAPPLYRFAPLYGLTDLYGLTPSPSQYRPAFSLQACPSIRAISQSELFRYKSSVPLSY